MALTVYLTKILLLIGFVAGVALHALAESKTDASASLGVRQESVGRDMQRLEKQMVTLISRLEASHPDQAERLKKGLAASLERQVLDKMTSLKGQLDKGQLQLAVKGQHAVGNDLDTILEILLDDKSEYEKLKERIDQLKEWREKIDGLSKEEAAQQRMSEYMQDPEKAMQSLEAKAKAVESMLAEQKSLNQKLEESMTSPQTAESMSELAEKQNSLQEKVKDMAESMAKEQPKAPGEEAMQEAAQSQSEAAKDMAEQKGSSAQSQQGKATESLEKALDELKEEMKALAQQDKENFEAMAEKQKETKKDTEAVKQEMAEQSAQSGEQQPGEQSMQEAEMSMSKASESLSEQKASQSAKQQQKAKEKLDEAKKELDEEIKELQEEQQASLLAELETLLRSMLAQQKRVSASTKRLYEKKQAKKWTREEDLRSVSMQKEELELVTSADKAVTMIEDNGSASVFTTVLGDMKVSLRDVANRLGASNPDALTQLQQTEIEQQIEDLLTALADNAENPDEQEPQDPQDSPPQDGPPQEQPLISKIAELKLLRAAQKRVNDGTRNVDSAHGKGEISVTDFKHVTQKLTTRQSKVHESTKALLGETPKGNKP